MGKDGPEGRPHDTRRHVRSDLSSARNPLFRKYGDAFHGKFGLTVTDSVILCHFHTLEEKPERPESIGVDVNMASAGHVASDLCVGSIDLTLIPRIQGAMARKRASIQRSISKDLRHQRHVLRRYKIWERRRVNALLHLAENEFLSQAGDRNIILEDLTQTIEECMKDTRGATPRRRLAVWTHVLPVNPRGSPSECPGCRGRMDHPEWRRSVCGNSKGDWHRDMAAATSIPSRGQKALRGTALSPSALHALLEAARWRPNGSSGPFSTPVKGDEANATLESLES